MQVEFKFITIRGKIPLVHIQRLDDSVFGIDMMNYMVIPKLETSSYKKISHWDIKVVKINTFLNYVCLEFNTIITPKLALPNIVLSYLKKRYEGEATSMPIHNIPNWMSRIEKYKTMTMNLHNYIQILDSDYYIDIFNPCNMYTIDELNKTTLNIPMYGGLILYEDNISVEERIAEYCIQSKQRTLVLTTTSTFNNWKTYESKYLDVANYINYDTSSYERIILCRPSNYILSRFHHVEKPFWILSSKMPDDKFIEQIYSPRSLYSDDLCNSIKTRRSIRCGRKWSIDIQKPKVIIHRIKRVSSKINTLNTLDIEKDIDIQQLIHDEFLLAFKISSEFHKVDFLTVPCIGDKMCNICYEEANCITVCNHSYCYSCIIEWWRKTEKKTCPVCRGSMIPIKTTYPKVPQKIDYIKKLVSSLENWIMITPLMAIHDIIKNELPDAIIIDPHTCKNNMHYNVKHLIFLHPLIDSKGRQNKAFEESIINTYDEMDNNMTVHYVLDEQFKESQVFENEPYH
uniref:RING-type domain-containing protein n=1 Tax=Megaviridae environmental sample TaxID=1737588 RepID=A0A5J6VJH2_9VIRU|nr:MAG: hypothetical protein [Megaviridae environmental sample]